jgi:hypothetical protein
MAGELGNGQRDVWAIGRKVTCELSEGKCEG